MYFIRDPFRPWLEFYDFTWPNKIEPIFAEHLCNVTWVQLWNCETKRSNQAVKNETSDDLTWILVSIFSFSPSYRNFG